MEASKYWIIHECTQGDSYFYCGYYETGLPVFNMAIACALHIASFENAKMIHKVLSDIIPCEILIVDGHDIVKVFP